MPSFAQEFQKFTVWLDSQEVDGKIIIVGWCRNNTAIPKYVNYDVFLKLKGQAIDTILGTTLTLPSSPTLLTKAIFTLKVAEFEQLNLVLRNKENEILAFDKMIPPPSKQKPVSIDQPTDPPSPAITKAKKSLLDIEIDGLVLDETRSKLARDFYETFYRNWSSLQIDAKGQTIIIREMPGRIGIGTSVIVEVDDRPVTQLNLQPRTEVIEDLAAQLVAALETYLNDPNNNSVIQGDDLIGSGIY